MNEEQRIEGSRNYVNDILRQLFEGHGVEADVQSGRVTFPANPDLWVEGELFRSYEGIVQLDVCLGSFDGDRVLGESIAGFGADLNAQASFAMQAFANASFHVLLPAFFARPTCHGTQRQTWKIGDPRTVYTGLITTVFGSPGKPGNPGLGCVTPSAYFQCRKRTRLGIIRQSAIYRNAGEGTFTEIQPDGNQVAKRTLKSVAFGHSGRVAGVNLRRRCRRRIPNRGSRYEVSRPPSTSVGVKALTPG